MEFNYHRQLVAQKGACEPRSYYIPFPEPEFSFDKGRSAFVTELKNWQFGYFPSLPEDALGAALPPNATLERLELATTGIRTEIDTDSLAAEVATSAAELREEEALERELAVLRSKCPGVPEFTRDELESIRHDAVERILDLLAGTMEARP